MGRLPKEIEAHYLEGREARRLREGAGELEFVRTMAILARELPPPPAVVLDVGGAAGVYAIPLAARGYRVSLIDPVALHVEQAREAAAAAGVEFAAAVQGDARNLPQAEASADVVLLLGPLYHLTERGDRLAALREAKRVLRPGGVVVAAGISRFASLIDGVASGYFADPAFRDIIAADLASGQHRNPTHHPAYFTTAFFHRPDDLEAEVREAGFSGAILAAVEGPVWSTAGFTAAWADPPQRAALLEFLASVERERSILGASAHFLAVGR